MPQRRPIPDSAYLMIAEDDQDDQILIRDAFSENGVSAESIYFVNDGQELVEQLAATLKLPRLILLDLNMPRKDGREALQEIKSNIRFKHVPVIVFTTSNSEEDIRLTYEHGGNTFFTKPPLYNELVDVLGTIKKYWFEKALIASY